MPLPPDSLTTIIGNAKDLFWLADDFANFNNLHKVRRMLAFWHEAAESWLGAAPGLRMLKVISPESLFCDFAGTACLWLMSALENMELRAALGEHWVRIR